jgi:hypothetical protein
LSVTALAVAADRLLAQSTIDRLQSSAHELASKAKAAGAGGSAVGAPPREGSVSLCEALGAGVVPERGSGEYGAPGVAAIVQVLHRLQVAARTLDCQRPLGSSPAFSEVR